MGALEYSKYAKRIMVKRGLPLQLIFFVTSRCNSRCSHCFYWKQLNKPKNELTLGEIGKFTKHIKNLVSVSLTGGEPLLRDDLPEIAEAFSRNCKVKNIVINTNGLMPEKAKETVKKILDKCKDSNILVGVSLDGLEKTHDELRGVKGNFKLVIETIGKLKELKKDYKNLQISTLTTCSSRNQEELSDLLKFVSEKLKPDNICYTLIRGDAKNRNLKERVDVKHYKDIINEKNALDKKYDFRSSIVSKAMFFAGEMGTEIIADVYMKNKYVTPCYAGALTGVIYESGDVYPCELLNKKMGNIRDYNYDFKKLWLSEEGDDIRAHIKSTKCFCTYECVMPANILFNPRHYPRLMKKMLASNPG